MTDLDLQDLHYGKTEEYNLEKEKIKIGKTTNAEHISTSVQLKENKENKEDYEASVVQFNVVEPHIRKKTINEKDKIVRETADDKGQHGERKILVSKKKSPEKVQWIKIATSIQISKYIIWIILGFLFLGFVGPEQNCRVSKYIIWIILGFLFLGFVGPEQNCRGIGLKVEGTFIEGGTATFTVQKDCKINGMTAAPNGKVLSIITNGIIEDEYKEMVTSEDSSIEWKIKIENLTSSNLSTVYELTCGFDCEKTKRLSQYRKGNGAKGMTYDLLLTWLCCLLTCMSWMIQ